LSRDESKLDRRIARLLDNDKPISKYDRVQRAVYLEAQITEAYEALAQEDLVPAVPEDDLGLRVRLHVRTAIDNIARNTGEIVERDSDCVKRLRYAIWEQMRAVRGVSVEVPCQLVNPNVSRQIYANKVRCSLLSYCSVCH
jgi:hypothetical protein